MSVTQVVTDVIEDGSITQAKLHPSINLVPVGSIAAFARSTPPSGWLACDGGSTTGWPALASVVGANVPDLRNFFIRGWTTGETLGGFKEDKFKQHNHTGSVGSAGSAHNHGNANSGNYVGNVNTARIFTGGSNWTKTPGNQGNLVAQTASGGDHSHSVTIPAAGGTETAPQHIILLYCIKT